MKDDPAHHSSEQIKRSMESYWKKTAHEQSIFLRKHLGAEEAGVLAEYLIESLAILSVESHDGDRATALVRILPTDSDIPSEVVPVACVFRNGLWEFSTSTEEQSPSVPDVQAVIGEPVTFQPGWKEPPLNPTANGRQQQCLLPQ